MKSTTWLAALATTGAAIWWAAGGNEPPSRNQPRMEIHGPSRSGGMRLNVSRGADAFAAAPAGPEAAGDADNVYLVQFGTNLSDWRTLFAFRNPEGKPLDFQFVDLQGASNRVGYYRAIWLGPLDGGDTNGPAWGGGGVGGTMAAVNGALVLGWNAATDNVGVAQYRLYENGVLLTNLLGNVTSFTIGGFDWSRRSAFRIEALDASGNLSGQQPVVFLPADKVAMIGDDGSRMYAFHLTADGTWSPLVQLGRWSRDIRGGALADYDRDGIIDLIAAYVDYWSPNWQIQPLFFRGRGDGSYAAAAPLQRVYGYSWAAGATAGDFDCDGNVDVFFCTGDTGSMALYWGRGGTGFDAENRDFPGSGRDLDAGDFNEDGIDDFVRGNCCDGMVRLYLSNGDRTFQPAITVGDSGEDPYGVTVGDFDEDGHLDVMANFASNGDVTFWQGRGDGTFTNGVVNGPRANLDVNNYGAMDAYDYNGDGHLDFLLTGYSHRKVWSWDGLGDGTFTNQVQVPGTIVDHSLGLTAPPLPPRMDVRIEPRDPAIDLGEPVVWRAAGRGVATNDECRWTFGTAPDAVAWLFGSANHLGQAVTNAYPAEGRFLARLQHRSAADPRVPNVRGMWVTVRGQRPEADPGGPYLFDESHASQMQWTGALSAAASTDDFGIARYIWNYGDGAIQTNATPAATHTWSTCGVWTVTLVVVDRAGLRDTNTTTVTFTPGAPPAAAITGPAVADETYAHNGTWTVSLNGRNATDDFAIWRYDWNFGQGRTGSGRDVSTTYSSPGTYTVALTVTDHAGQTSRTTHTLQIKANAPPVPAIDGERLLDESVARSGQWYGEWTASASTDDTGIFRYQWSFGDGSTASGASVSHWYGDDGVYPLKVTVTDHGEQSVSLTKNVVVIANDPPVARIAMSPEEGEGSQTMHLSAEPSTDDYGIYLYRWLLPPRAFPFDGPLIDGNLWRYNYVAQNDRLVATPVRNSWDECYFFSTGMRFRRGVTAEWRVDTAPTDGSHAMVGLRNLDFDSAHYNRIVYAIYFQNGMVEVYERGGYRGQFGAYTKGISYDCKVETKPGSGARYYIRPSGGTNEYRMFRDTNDRDEGEFAFGATVHSGVFAFDDLRVDQAQIEGREIDIACAPNGTVTLEVVDHAMQTNRSAVALRSVAGARPVAAIDGSLAAGRTSMELGFSAYTASDDHGIALYAWNFGDGSAPAYGSAVSHAWALPGTYTMTLTVTDYAGQTSTAERTVTISGEAGVVAVPWRILGEIELPHETWSGKEIVLKASAPTLPLPFTYVWDFGDGTAPSGVSTVTTAAAACGLEARHAYLGAEGLPFTATITVTATNGARYSDSYPVLIRPFNIDTEMNVAIDNGLWYLHKVQNRYAIDAQNPGGYWWGNGYRGGPSASAVQAFEINGHLASGDANRDPYVDTVKRGLNFLLTMLNGVNIGNQTYGNPDGNNNALAITCGSEGREPYQLGQYIDAFVASGTPEMLAEVGGANVRGRNFYDLVQDMADTYVWGQSDYTDERGGGWRYGWNSDIDNSAAQWGAVGLRAAEDFFGAFVPQWVKDRNRAWQQYSRTPSGGFGYGGPGNYPATTASCLVQMGWTKTPTTDPLWRHGEDYIADNWNTYVDWDNVYVDFAVTKAMRTAYPAPVTRFSKTGKDWFLDPANGMARISINRQRADGSWIATREHVTEAPFVTAWRVIILTSSLFQQGPVAVIHARPNPTGIGYPVVFDARASFHLHPSYEVVEYRWDFSDADGVDFDTPDAVGAVATNAWSDLATNTVTLQVRDNGNPTLFDTATVQVKCTVPPHPPTADAAGPYVVATGQDIELDGSGSFDVDEADGDGIAAWDWEIDFARPLDYDELHGERVILRGGFPTPGRRDIGLRVTDRTAQVYPGFQNRTAEDFTYVEVYNLVITNLVARPKENKCQLTWKAAGDVAAIMRSTVGPNAEFEEIGRTTNRYATYLDTTVDLNQDYFYRIYVYEKGGTTPIGISNAEYTYSRQRGADNKPPEFIDTPLNLARVGVLYEQALVARDPEGDALRFSLLQAPTGMTVNATNGLLHYIPAPNQLGPNEVSAQVSDGQYKDVLNYTLVVFPATNHAPVAEANGPYDGLEGAAVTFASAGTGDADGDPLRYAWNFGDGLTSTNPNPTHVYRAAGNYRATLFVNDGLGGKAQDTAPVHIERPNRPPVAVLAGGPSLRLRLGEALAGDAGGSYDYDGDRLAFAWNWGDGTAAGAGAQATHTYAATGTYSGALAVSDGRGGEDTENFTVRVDAANRPPAARLDVTQAGRHIGDEFLFDASASTDPDGDPVLFRWSFGDQTQTTGIEVSHVYRALGEYSVVLTATDSHGGVGSATQKIEIVNAPPIFTNAPPISVTEKTAYVYGPGVRDIEGDAVRFSLPTGPGTMLIDTNSGALHWTPLTADIGEHPVVLRATDARGAFSNLAFTIYVLAEGAKQYDVEPTRIVTTNVTVDSQTLARSGTVEVRLRNRGSDPIPLPFTVTIFEDRDSDHAWTPGVDERLGWGTVPAGLARTDEGILTLGVSGTALFRDNLVHAFADSEGVVAETAEGNNVRWSGDDCDPRHDACTDLSASFLRTDRSGLPALAVLTARLGNCGSVAVPTNVAMSFYRGDPQAGGVRVGTVRSTQALDPGEYQDLAVAWQTPAITSYVVYVVADDLGDGTGAHVERSEANNRFSAVADLSANDPPVADAGPDQEAPIGAAVGLNGRGSRDPEGKPLTYRWAIYSIPVGSSAQLQGADTAQASLTPDVPGEYTVQLIVSDGTQDSAPDTVVVMAVDPSANHAPTITSRPSFVAMVTVPYAYPVTATDPDGDRLRYRLNQAPAGMTINTNTGLIAWTPAAEATPYVQIVAEDPKGASFTQGYRLTVLPYENVDPEITTTPVQTAAPGAAYRYDVNATDFNVSDTLTYSLPVKPSGMSINGASGLIAWTPAAGQLGGHAVTVRVADNRGGVAEQAFTVMVANANDQSPRVLPIADQTVVSPAAFQPVALDDFVIDPDTARSQLVWTVSGATALQVAVSGRVARVTYSAGAAAAETLTFLATDPQGNSGAASARFAVKQGDRAPVAAIANLSETDTTSIETGTFELRGTADDADAVDEVLYRVGLYTPQGEFVADMTPAPLTAAGYHAGRVQGDVLATLDFTALRNDVYDVYLEVRAGGRTATAWGTVAADTPLKIGRMTFSQRDLSLPVHGITLAVIRTYDSINPESRDFGYGWSYSVADLSMAIGEVRARTQDLDGSFFSLRTGGSRDVTLDMPDTGRRVTFRFGLQGGGMFRMRAVWTPPRGVNATLVPTCNANMIKLWGLPPYWEAAGISVDVENFDFPGFILTTHDGRQYRLEREDLGEHYIAQESGEGYGFFVHAYGEGYLRRITERDGAATQLVRSGTQLQAVEHTDAADNSLRTLFFERDAQGRIAAAYTRDGLDAAGQPAGLPSMKYEYDAKGNLWKASRLADAGDTNHPVYAVTTYTYENPRFPHHVTAITDARGVTPVRTEYDEDGRVVATVDANGNRTEVRHDDAARTETVYDRQGNPTLYVYDDRGNILAETDPLGQTTRYTYDADGNRTSVTDPAGDTQTSEYDGAGNLTAVTDALGNRTTYAYDSSGNLLSVTDAAGHTASNAYDAAGNLLTSVDATGARTEHRYDNSGNLTATVDALGNVTARYGYDTAGNPTSVLLAGGLAATSTYDGAGNPTGRQYTWVNPADSNDVRVVKDHVVYDAAGNVVARTDRLGNTASTAYDGNQQPVERRDAAGNVTRLAYDARGLLVETRYADGSVIRSTYDESGRPVVQTDRHLPGQAANGTRRVYDTAGRVARTERLAEVVVAIRSVTNGGSVVAESRFVQAGGILASNTWAYDGAGRVVRQTDAHGQSTRYEYDAAGHRTAVIDAAGSRTDFVYDAAGRLTLMHDARGSEVRSLYDAAGRNVRTIFEDGTTLRRSWDAAGRLASATDQAGNVRRFEYDPAGRLAAVILPQTADPEAGGGLVEPRFEYTIDAYGNPRRVRDAKGRETGFTYDEFNRRVSRTLPLGQTERQSYDALGRPLRKLDFKQQATEWLYDSLGRVTHRNLYASGSNSPSESVAFAYDALGRLSAIDDGRGATSKAYDLDGRLLSIASPEGAIHYEYDPATGRKTRTWTAQSDTRYGYDEPGRLKTVSVVRRHGRVLASPDVTAYRYDAVGNRAGVTLPNGVRTEYTYDALNRLTRLTHRGATNNLLASYAYTLAANGRRTQALEILRQPGGASITNRMAFTYDSLNRLVREAGTVGTGTPYAVDYAYDLVGNRLKRTVSLGPQTLQTTYAYDANDRLLVESNAVTVARGTMAAAPGGRACPLEGRVARAWRQQGPFALLAGLILALLVPLRIRGYASGLALRGVPVRLTPATAMFLRRSSFTPLARCTASLLAALLLLDPLCADLRAREVGAALQALTLGTWGAGGSVTTYAYDANGSVVLKTTTGPRPETVEYAYDLQNRMISATTTRAEGGQQVVETSGYAYNADGVRIRSESRTAVDGSLVSAETNSFLLDSHNHTGFAQVLEERAAAGAAPTRSYTIGDDVISQTTDDGTPETNYLLYDGHGSTRQLVDEHGAVVAIYNYDAYGLMLGGNPTVSNAARTRLLYTGEQFDEGLQQYYLRARYYDPGNGRFASLDPLEGRSEDPQSLHRYTYTACDPVNCVDPSGEALSIEFVITIAIIAVLFTLYISGRSVADYFGGRAPTPTEADRLKAATDDIASVGVASGNGSFNQAAYALKNARIRIVKVSVSEYYARTQANVFKSVLWIPEDTFSKLSFTMFEVMLVHEGLHMAGIFFQFGETDAYTVQSKFCWAIGLTGTVSSLGLTGEDSSLAGTIAYQFKEYSVPDPALTI